MESPTIADAESYHGAAWPGATEPSRLQLDLHLGYNAPATPPNVLSEVCSAPHP